MERQAPAQARHPKALYILFFTEMWERFAYYLMVGILLLYLIDDKTGGKGFSEGVGADIVGSFIALVYLTPFIGGLLADRHLGYIKSIFLGGSLMSAGYFCIAIPGNTALFVGLALIIVGNGFFIGFKYGKRADAGNAHTNKIIGPLDFGSISFRFCIIFSAGCHNGGYRSS